MNAFLGWLIATLIRRFGGLKLYRELRPAFSGDHLRALPDRRRHGAARAAGAGRAGMTAMTWDF